jgi:RsiW-degrading membrane proteinase PrsW (M82 family)
MLHLMTSFFNAGFYFPGYTWTSILLAIAIGIVFGGIWLFLYRPPMLKTTGLWLVFIAAAFLTWAAVSFIQLPLQVWTKDAMVYWWNPQTLSTAKFILLSYIPIVLIAGIVQEAAKIAPVFFFRQRSKTDFTPQLGLIAGAVAGAGFGIFEAIWKLNLILPVIGFASSLSNSTLRVLTAAGFSYRNYSLLGFSPLMGTFGSFYSIVFHISVTALVGHGLAKRRGWQFYLLAVILNALINYGAFLTYLPRITVIEGIIWVSIPVVLITVFALWLRWHKPRVKPAVSGPADVTPLIIPPTPIS